MKVRRVALTDLTESQAHKLRLLKAALEQVMGHEVQTMTLSYTDNGSPRLRVGFSVTLLGASSPAATSTAPAVPAPSPGKTAFKRCSGRSPSRWHGPASYATASVAPFASSFRISLSMSHCRVPIVPNATTSAVRSSAA